jgi:predicted Zn-dependent peptidase
MDLLNNMPRHDWRIDNIKSYLLQQCQTSAPNARNLPFSKDYYKLLGFEGEPMDEMIKQIESLTMDDIMKFYDENIKGKPVVIGIMGNPKDFNVNDLSKFGKVNRIGPKQVYNTTDSYFY